MSRVYQTDDGKWVVANNSGWLPGNFHTKELAEVYAAMMPVENLLLQGIVGSHAYGLATPESDVDRLGVYAAPTRLFHGLRPPVGKQATKQTHGEEDITVHEAGKFALLALQCNPTVTELLWLPRHEVVSTMGQDLIRIRQAFLSSNRVRDAYLGYARAQLTRMENYTADRPRESKIAKPHRPEKVAKHGRHFARLLIQGSGLYLHGALNVELREDQANEVRWCGEALAEGQTREAQDWLLWAEKRFAKTGALPDKPDEASVEAWLQKIRSYYYEEDS